MEPPDKRLILYLILLAVAVVLAWLITGFIFAEKTPQRPYFSDNLLFLRATTGVLIGIEAELWQTANKYGLDYNRFYKLAMCESTLNPNAEGKAGELGIFQFKEKTFSFYCEGNWYDTKDQIECAAKMISQGLEKHWTCKF